MTGLWKPEPKSFYEAEVWEYPDRLVAHCTCNNCGEKFSLTLRASKVGMNCLTDDQKKRRIFSVAHKRHDCNPEALKGNPSETNRIINKWHEYKLKVTKQFGAKQ